MMIQSVYFREFSEILENAAFPKEKEVNTGSAVVKIKKPFPSLQDWREAPPVERSGQSISR